MLFDPKGMYPEGTQFVGNGFFHADREIAFSVVYGGSWTELDSDAPYSEFNWASPEELRLLTSLVLCERRDEVYCRLYPVVRYGPELDVQRINLCAPSTVSKVRELIFRNFEGSDKYNHPSLRNIVDKNYSLAESERYSLNRLPDIWNALSDANYVLMRGVYALIKADMLTSHYEFYEEAIATLYIALEASFSLVVRTLEGNGVRNPSAHDAAVWLHEHFDEPFGLPAPQETEKYFEEFYENRIMTLHPASRFGDLPYAPSMHDDYSHLRRSLREIFVHLLMGHHGPDYFEDLSKFKLKSANSNTALYNI